MDTMQQQVIERMPAFAALMSDKGWTADVVGRELNLDYPEGADSREWKNELYDIAKNYFGRYGWQVREMTDGTFKITLDAAGIEPRE